MSEQEKQNPVVPIAEGVLAITAGVVVVTASAPAVVLAAGVTGVVALAGFVKDAYDYTVDSAKAQGDESMDAYNKEQIKYQIIADHINANIARQKETDMAQHHREASR